MKKTILLIEDEESQRILYQEEIEKHGYAVMTAADGHEGIEVIEKHPIDLAILDIRMPKMDGLETLGKLLSSRTNLPVIIYTAYSHYKTDFMSWAADSYLVKSSDLSELTRKIKELLGD